MNEHASCAAAARADHACVRLEHEPAGLRITVTDNGIGVAGPDASRR